MRKSILIKILVTVVLVVFFNQINAQSTSSGFEDSKITKEVLNYMKKVADWQLANPTGKRLNEWEYGPFYQGLMKLYSLSKDKKYYNATVEMGNTVNWETAARPYDANSFAIVPAFADLYEITKDVKMIDKCRFAMDMPLARNLQPEVNFSKNKYWYEWWTWCDALFMAPPAYARLSVLLNKPQYMEYMVKNWWLTSDYLYSKEDSLFFRDDSFFEQQTANGKKVFWSRGNGWVIGGLCGVMSNMKKTDPQREKFEQQFVQMCDKLSKLQMVNGSWSQSLIDPAAHPQKETSGTAFFCYGFAWGINNGLLSREKYLPIVQKAWQALTGSVNDSGKLGYVQKVGDKPANVKADDTESYGSGAFLLAGSEVYKLLKEQHTPAQDPITAAWIKAHLRKSGPKIILTSEQLTAIKSAVISDEAIKAYYQYLYKNAVSLINLPVLERVFTGRRLLRVSRAAIRRIGTLSIVYAISGEKRFLDRANAEMTAVCNFSDWNPDIALDYSEMAYAVSIGLDWTLNKLPESTKQLAKKALTDYAITPGLKEGPVHWVSGINNWNQVCHGGLSIAAIAIADKNPALAAQVISRAVEKTPNALKSYAPDGAYPEGSHYWHYGTSYTLLTISAFESAFGTDFGMSKSPGFIESARFIKMLASPSGLYFNYFDADSVGDNGLENQELLSWFASKTDNGIYYNPDQLKLTLDTASTSGINPSKLNGAALTWLIKAKRSNIEPLPLSWKGDGLNPLIIFRSARNDASEFFLGAKGGRANLSHGNMDAGSFVFDLNGVRWSVDLGMQDYTSLEAVMGVEGLWYNGQNSQRWTLLSKNNFGHSTLTVNDQLHVVDGFASLINFKESDIHPEGEFDLTRAFEGQLKSAKRKFIKVSDQKLRVEDVLELSDQTKTVTWAMMTRADAKIINGGILLSQHGKTLSVLMKQPLDAEIKVVSKNPPPLEHDMKIPDLKRLEFKISANSLKASGSRIVVELTGE
jgi:rhamnogalacturonyl hydrolase YesR